MAKKANVAEIEIVQEKPNALPIPLKIKIEGKASYKDGDKEVVRNFEFEIPCDATAENIGRVFKALFVRKFAEFLSGLKSRGELPNLTDEEVIEKFIDFMDRWLRGEKASRAAREFSLADAAELVLVSYFRRQGKAEKEAKELAKDARKLGGELWEKALKKVQEDF